MQKRKTNQVLTYVDLCKWWCRRGRKGTVLNVRASKLSCMLSLEKVERWYFSSHSKVLSCNLFGFISQTHHYCHRIWPSYCCGNLWDYPLLLGTDPSSSLTDGYNGGWTWFYTKQHFHIPYLAHLRWSIGGWASDPSWNVKFLSWNFCIWGQVGRESLSVGCKSNHGSLSVVILLPQEES